MTYEPMEVRIVAKQGNAPGNRSRRWRVRFALLALTILIGGVVSACGEGTPRRFAMDQWEIDERASYSITDERRFVRHLTSDDFGEGFPATYRQPEGGELVIHGDGTGHLDRFLIAECSGPVIRWHEVTGPVGFAEETGYGTWLYCVDGALLFNTLVMQPWEFAPVQIEFASCVPGNVDSAQLVIKD